MLLYHPLAGRPLWRLSDLRSNVEPAYAPVIDAAAHFAARRVQIETEIQERQRRLHAWPSSPAECGPLQLVRRAVTQIDLRHALLALCPEELSEALFSSKPGAAPQNRVVCRPSAGFMPACRALAVHLNAAPPASALGAVERLLAQRLAITWLAGGPLGLMELVDASDAVDSVAALTDLYVRNEYTLGECSDRIRAAQAPTLEAVPDVLIDRRGIVHALDASITEAPGVVLQLAADDPCGTVETLLDAWGWKLRFERQPALADLQIGRPELTRIGSSVGSRRPTLREHVSHAAGVIVLSPKGREFGWRSLVGMSPEQAKDLVQQAVTDPSHCRLLFVMQAESRARLGELLPDIRQFPVVEVPANDEDERLMSWLAQSSRLDAPSFPSLRGAKSSDPSRTTELGLSAMLGAFRRQGSQPNWRQACFDDVKATGTLRAPFTRFVERTLRGEATKRYPSYLVGVCSPSALSDLEEVLRFVATVVGPEPTSG